ncbi:MAG: pantoate--beta-alanine ligase [Deltaproteobacteria bacterium]|nr:MAG: pantoate--beta-alanine ligase [Deltaproteobacteria bacterium]
MEIIDNVNLMQQKANELRLHGNKIALVPTMGYFHEGHLELMRIAKKYSDVLVVSIFVNPIQFGPSEDYNRYPRDIKGDEKKAKEVGVDILFIPSVEEMYPEGFQTKVCVERLTQHLCGKFRPGHFDGVTTVVAKLFHIIKPHIAVFGQKDYQQLMVIKRMVKDLNMDIEIIGAPTFRETDGLAMSSRNTYLSKEQRESALCLKKSIDMAKSMVHKGICTTSEIKKAIEELIRSHPFTRIEYISICDPDTLEEIEEIKERALLAMAVYVGKARLIDNAIIEKYK